MRSPEGRTLPASQERPEEKVTRRPQRQLQPEISPPPRAVSPEPGQVIGEAYRNKATVTARPVLVAITEKIPAGRKPETIRQEQAVILQGGRVPEHREKRSGHYSRQRAEEKEPNEGQVK